MALDRITIDNDHRDIVTGSNTHFDCISKWVLAFELN